MKVFNSVIQTFNTQLLLTSRFPGLMSRCNTLAECKYFNPENTQVECMELLTEFFICEKTYFHGH